METATKKKYTEFTCTKCDITKPISQFHKDSSTKRGHRTICKSCKSSADSKRPADIRKTGKPTTPSLTEDQIVRNLKSRANYNAIVKLIETHSLEFDRYVKAEQKKLGLDFSKPTWIPAAKLG